MSFSRRLASLSLVAAVAAAIFTPSPAGAQTLHDLEQGEIVRFDSVGSAWTRRLPRASFAGVSDAAVHLRIAGRDLRIERDRLKKLQVRRGTSDYRWFGTVFGAAAGCFVGLQLTGESSQSGLDIPSGSGCAIVGVIGTALGYVGGRAMKELRWLDVDLDAPARQARLDVGVRFGAG
ncbi:MAG: hypothetical protein PVF05_00810 [Gemmatimonadales bacterium]|jgi:hypothetical protein